MYKKNRTMVRNSGDQQDTLSLLGIDSETTVLHAVGQTAHIQISI